MKDFKLIWENSWFRGVITSIIAYFLISLFTSKFQGINLLPAFKKVFSCILYFLNIHVRVWHIIISLTVYFVIRGIFQKKKIFQGNPNELKELNNVLNMANDLEYNEQDNSNVDFLLERTSMIIRKVFGENSPYLEKLNSIEFPSPLEVPEIFDEKITSFHKNDWLSAKQRMINLIKVMLEDINSINYYIEK